MHFRVFGSKSERIDRWRQPESTQASGRRTGIGYLFCIFQFQLAILCVLAHNGWPDSRCHGAKRECMGTCVLLGLYRFGNDPARVDLGRRALDDPSVPSKGDSRIALTVRSVFVGRPGGALGPTAPPGWGRAPALLASVWTKSQVSRLTGVSQWPRKRGNATVTQTVKIVARAQVANKAHSTPT